MTTEPRQRRALVVTGEASGDLHGANMIRAARELDPDLAFFGVGGSRMEEAGCEILVRGETIAVMGLVEVLGHLPTIWGVFRKLERILAGSERPDLLVCIDFPDFNLRLAKVAKRYGVPVLYYVSPQVWAWRRGRVKKIAKVVDRLACILPFEPALYQGLDLDVEYVGNPLTDEAVVSRDRETFLHAAGLDPALPVVGLFPGSRHSELRYNFATIVAAAAMIRARLPQTQFLLPVATSLGRETLLRHLADSNLPVHLSDENIYDLAHACNAVIAVSGTVTLQTALVGTPMAIFYRVAKPTYAIGRLLVNVPFIGLANIVAERKVVPEFIQDEATPQAISDEILHLLSDPAYDHAVRAGLQQVRDRIGPPGCARRVASMAVEMSRGIVRKEKRV